MNIEFYIPKYEEIPTSLRLKVDGKQVDYNRVEDMFAYDFHFYEQTEEESLKISEEIAIVMCNQSYDHGQSWRVTDIAIVQQEDRYAVGVIVRVKFRIRDSY
ncbi:MAG: hypothetical protein ACLSVX_12455 [Massilimicrobiota timonensis]